jgi:prevent-host-death family protein
MKTVTAADANRNFSSLLREARHGEVYVVISRGKPVATIGPVESASSERHSAKESLLGRLRHEKVSGVRTWTRDELYDEADE